ncbi:MAG: hypothetical protein PHE84_01450 [bacterium]|nr:hypothetical protein [bacterium]
MNRKNPNEIVITLADQPQVDLEGSDIQVIHQSYISITTLSIDLTNYRILERLQQWEI